MDTFIPPIETPAATSTPTVAVNPPPTAAPPSFEVPSTQVQKNNTWLMLLIIGLFLFVAGTGGYLFLWLR